MCPPGRQPRAACWTVAGGRRNGTGYDKVDKIAGFIILICDQGTIMSRSAFSAKEIAVYLFVVGPVLVFAPNFLLTMFGIAPTSAVWIRVVGVIAFDLGVYVWIAARHENKPFLAASVYPRGSVFCAFVVFALTGLASPMIVLFGLIDLGGGLWTWHALQADARSDGPAQAGVAGQ
jgi:hypothetical protein